MFKWTAVSIALCWKNHMLLCRFFLFSTETSIYVKYERLVSPITESCPGSVSEIFSTTKSRKYSIYNLERIRKTPVSLPIFQPCPWRFCSVPEALEEQSFLAVSVLLTSAMQTRPGHDSHLIRYVKEHSPAALRPSHAQSRSPCASGGPEQNHYCPFPGSHFLLYIKVVYPPLQF